METSLFNRLQATLLAIVTVGLFVLAVLNFRQERNFQQPDDGVWWSEATNGSGLVAEKVLPDSPAQRAGIRQNDLLTGVGVPLVSSGQSKRLNRQSQADDTLSGVKLLPGDTEQQPGAESASGPAQVNYTPILRLPDLERELYRTGSYFKIYYKISRGGIPLDELVIPEPMDRSMFMGLRIIGLIYLAIGIYVLFRRWTAPRATHFYLFCLVSFALYALSTLASWMGWTAQFSGSMCWPSRLQPALFRPLCS